MGASGDIRIFKRGGDHLFSLRRAAGKGFDEGGDGDGAQLGQAVVDAGERGSRASGEDGRVKADDGNIASGKGALGADGHQVVAGDDGVEFGAFGQKALDGLLCRFKAALDKDGPEAAAGLESGLGYLVQLLSVALCYGVVYIKEVPETI